MCGQKTSILRTQPSAQGQVPRKDAFAEDKEVPVQFRATLSDYKGSGYDRGHQAPAADMRSTANTMKQSFLLTNMTPQLPALNQGAWRILEEKTRQWAITYKSVQVITGPIFTHSDGAIGNGVTTLGVPLGFGVIVFTIVITGIYVRRANGRYDALTQAILKDAAR